MQVLKRLKIRFYNLFKKSKNIESIPSHCDLLGIPKRLHSNDREIDNNFESSESLFRRFNSEVKEIDGKLQIPATSVFPLKSDDSYNRYKYSENSADVLFNTKNDGKGHYQHYGIIEIKIADIEALHPAKIETENRFFKINAEHKPEPCMFPHSELRIYEEKGGELISVKPEGPPKTIKSHIRDILKEKYVVIKVPEKNP